jgi:hypothetical protein
MPHTLNRAACPVGIAVDAATTNGCTPLYIAANNGCAEAASTLLRLGADPDAETSSGCTPLHAGGRSGMSAERRDAASGLLGVAATQQWWPGSVMPAGAYHACACAHSCAPV